MSRDGWISQDDLDCLKRELSPLVGLRLSWLSIPAAALGGFEPSQLAVITNTIADAALPQVGLLAIDDEEDRERLGQLGLEKAGRLIGERESYPDYEHRSGFRIELKGLFVDNADLDLKRPPTAREPSARIKENVTSDVVEVKRDALLVAATQLRERDGFCVPTIVDIGLFSMAECVAARDQRLADAPGRWFGRTPKVLSLAGRRKMAEGLEISEGDFERDTNFGKLNRIPHPGLAGFLQNHGYRTPGMDRRIAAG